MSDEEKSKALAQVERVLMGQTGSLPVDFISVEPEMWGDASMGWPEPGHSYAQMITEGYRITARAAGKIFECRVSGETVRCRVIE